MAGQQPDIIEAIGDDVQHRKQPWKPGEKELVERQTEAAEQMAKALKHIAEHLESGGGEEPPESQPKAK